jgi:hypothetical protein
MPPRSVSGTLSTTVSSSARRRCVLEAFCATRSLFFSVLSSCSLPPMSNHILWFLLSLFMRVYLTHLGWFCGMPSLARLRVCRRKRSRSATTLPASRRRTSPPSPRWMLSSATSSTPVCCTLSCPRVPASPAAPTATFWRVRNSTSTSASSRRSKFW